MSVISCHYSTPNCIRVLTNSFSFASRSKYLAHRLHIPETTCLLKEVPNSAFSGNPLILTSTSRRHKCPFFVPFDAKNPSSGEENRRAALETVLKLYSAIKNKCPRDLSDLIGDECRCVCNFFSFFQPFQRKKQVLEFFTCLIKSLGNNIEFVVKLTLHDGVNVGVSWRLEWIKKHVALGKGYSFYICQIYQGKVIIRNMDMFMEPLVHIEPFRLKIMGCMMAIVDKLSLCAAPKGIIIKKRLHTSLFVLVLIAVTLLFLKPGFY